MPHHDAYQVVVDALEVAGHHLRNGRTCCPGHGSTNPTTLSVDRGDGCVLLKCHSEECSAEVIAHALGLSLRDLFDRDGDGYSGVGAPLSRTKKPKVPATFTFVRAEDAPPLPDTTYLGTWVATYLYIDAQGMLRYCVTRHRDEDGGKVIRPWHLNQQGQWELGLPSDIPRVLYRLGDVLRAKAEGRGIVFVEGEKDADALAAIGVIATTIAGGVPGPLPDDLAETLTGMKVAIIPDNDDDGRAFARKIANAISGYASSVCIVDLPNVPAKGDSSDWIAAGGGRRQLNELIASASEFEPQGTEDDADDEQTHDVPRLPADALYGPIGDLVRGFEPTTEASPAGILVSLLVFLGAALGRSAYVKAGGTRHPPNLFALLVGPTSRGRKGTAVRAARHVLQRVAPTFARLNLKAGGLSSGQGIIYHVRDPRPGNLDKKGQPTPGDPGVSDKRLLVVEDEFAVALKMKRGDTSTLDPVMRSAWDSGSLSTLSKGDPLTATDAHVAILGSITAEELRTLLVDTDYASGFANRFLFAWVERTRLLPLGEEPDDAALAPMLHTIREALAAREGAEERAVPLAVSARARYDAFYIAESTTLSAGARGTATARGTVIVLRVALIYALIDRSTVITLAHLEAALALWQFAKASLFFCVPAGAGALDPDARKVLEALDAAGPIGLTRSDLRRSAFRSNNATAERFQKALDALLRNGMASFVSEPSRSGGRRAERWLHARHKAPDTAPQEAEKPKLVLVRDEAATGAAHARGNMGQMGFMGLMGQNSRADRAEKSQISHLSQLSHTALLQQQEDASETRMRA